MKLVVDDIEYTVTLISLKRSIKTDHGSNNGIFLSGDKFYDTKKSYYQYNVTINPLRGYEEDYETLFIVLGEDVDSHLITMPWGQSEITFDAHVASVSDSCQKLNQPLSPNDPRRSIWSGMSFTLESTKPIDS